MLGISTGSVDIPRYPLNYHALPYIEVLYYMGIEYEL